MTYQPHALLRFGGTWFVDEIWSCGIRIGTDSDEATVAQWVETLTQPDLETPSALHLRLAQGVRAWFARSTSRVSSRATLNYVELNAIGPDGRYADPGNPHRIEYAGAEILQGPGGFATWPQLATVVSFLPAQRRGLATRGRIYVPTGLTSDGSGRIASGDAQGMAASAAELLEWIGDSESLALAGEPRAVIASDLGSPGPMRIITEVRVGDVVDTQRRRRNQLAEVYYPEPVETA